jgi:hypothetical protein
MVAATLISKDTNMENYVIDIAHDIDLKNITAEKTNATVDNDVRVVVKSGVTKQQAHLALLAISNTLIGDQIILD